MLVSKLLKIAALSAAMVCSFSAFADSYPSKAINVVVPYPAGGSSDFVARYMTKEMSTILKQSMLVDNVVGVGGALGTMKVLNAAPDGYSVLLGSVTELILTPLANANAKYKPEDLKTVAFLGQADIMLAVRKDLGVNTMDEFIALAKKNPEKPLSFCSNGIGSQFHLIAEKFNQTAGIKATHVPYGGFPPCVTNMIGNIVDYAFLPIAGPFPGHIDSGNLKIISIAGTKPHARFSKAPLTKATKGFENFVYHAWASMNVSAKVPDDVVVTLNKAAHEAFLTATVKTNVAASGSTLLDPMTAAESQAHYLREVAKYQAIAKTIDLKPQQ